MVLRWRASRAEAPLSNICKNTICEIEGEIKVVVVVAVVLRKDVLQKGKSLHSRIISNVGS